MKRAVAAVFGLLVVAGVGLGVDALGDLTQNRPDPLVAGTESEVVFEVRSHRFFKGDLDEAARALWSVCLSTIHDRGGYRELTRVADDRYRTTITPAVGKYGRKRLAGCLSDATVDRVQGRLVTLTSTEAVAAP
jgi:hypothetical protein